MTRLIYFSRDFTTHDHRFLSALAGSSYETYYLRLERRGTHLGDQSIPPGIRTITWSGGKSPYTFSQAPKLLLELRQLIRELKPDLIHAGPIQSCAFLVALSGFQPLISMSWGYDLLQDADRSWIWRKITQYTLSRSTRLITDCQTVSEKAKRLGMPDEKKVTFPWGVDLKTFVPSSDPIGEDRHFTLLSTRTWEPMYGMDVLTRGFAKAAQQIQGLRLLLLGNGSQSANIKQILDQAGVLKQVVFPGQVDQGDLPRYYHEADLYLSASHIDGSSVSLMEALACGLPVLVSDIPGNQEWVKPGVNGWWFRDGDADDLAIKIRMAVEQHQTLPPMGRAARQVAEAKADWSKNFSLLLDAYEMVLREG